MHTNLQGILTKESSNCACLKVKLYFGKYVMFGVCGYHSLAIDKCGDNPVSLRVTTRRVAIITHL